MNIELTMFIGYGMMAITLFWFLIRLIFFDKLPTTIVGVQCFILVIGITLMVVGATNYVQCRSITISTIIDDNTVRLLGKECRYRENFGDKFDEWINQHTYEPD